MAVAYTAQSSELTRDVPRTNCLSRKTQSTPSAGCGELKLNDRNFAATTFQYIYHAAYTTRHNKAIEACDLKDNANPELRQKRKLKVKLRRKVREAATLDLAVNSANGLPQDLEGEVVRSSAANKPPSTIRLNPR